MKYIKYTFVMILMLFSGNLLVLATCTEEDYEKLMTVANKVAITYQYNEDYEKLESPIYGNFNLYITGLTNDIVVYDYSSLATYYYSSVKDGVLTIKDVGGGDRNIYIKGNDSCKGTTLRKITVNVPNFNYYAVSKYCTGIDGKEFVYCDKWYQMPIKKSTFLAELEIFKSKNDNKDDKPPVKPNIEDDNWFKDFVLDYYVYITIGVVLIIILIVWLVARKKRDVL